MSFSQPVGPQNGRRHRRTESGRPESRGRRRDRPHPFLLWAERRGYLHPDPRDPRRLGERDRVAQVVAQVRRRIGRGGRTRVAELGCGPAFIGLRLAELGCGVVLADSRREFVTHARLRRRRGRLHFLCGDVEEGGGLAPGVLDAVVLADVIEYCRHPRRALAAALRTLRRGGILVLTSRNRARIAIRRRPGFPRSDTDGRFRQAQVLRMLPAGATVVGRGYLGASRLLGSRAAAGLRTGLPVSALAWLHRGLARLPLAGAAGSSHFMLVVRRDRPV